MGENSDVPTLAKVAVAVKVASDVNAAGLGSVTLKAFKPAKSLPSPSLFNEQLPN